MRTKTTLLNYIFLVFIAMGIFLALINFFNVRSLWLDEAMLALNIVNKPLNELLNPLEFNQVAPIGFLFIEKFFAYLGGGTDWSLRIFPMLSFFLSVYVIYLLTYKVIKAQNFALFSAAFYSLSFSVIVYSSEVKQYMSDVLICLILLLSTLIYLKNNNRKQLFIYALIGAISVWISNISVILLFPAGLYVLYKTQKANKNYIDALVVLGSWSISFASYYLLFIYNHPTKPMMLTYWNNKNAFLPQNIFSVEFYTALYHKALMVFGLLGHHTFFTLLILPFCFGVLFLGRHQKRAAFLLISPFIIHLFISYLMLYPFDSRLILYLTPIIIIIITCGIYYFFTFFKKPKFQYQLRYILILPLIFNLIVSFNKIPVQREEIKKSLLYLNDELLKDDKVYVYYATYPAFLFYKRHFLEIFKMDENNIIISKENRENWANYENDINKIKGPVWLLFSHGYWVKNPNGINEKDYILALLKKNGYQIIEEKNFNDASIYKAIPIKPAPNIIYK